MQAFSFRIFLVVLLAGCATQTVSISATQSTWQGASYEEAVSRWGVPARSTILADGRDARTWVSDSAEGGLPWYQSLGIFGGSRGVGVGVGTGVVIGGPGGGQFTRCERTLFFREGLVVEQLWQGPPDYCSNFRRY